MVFPVVTKDLALRVGRSEADHMASWLESIGREADSPFAVEIRRFGDTVALRSKGPEGATLGPLFNRVLCFGDAEVARLEEIVRFYGETGQPCRIDALPYAVEAPTLRRLFEAGFCPIRSHDHLYGVPLADGGDGIAPEITVREIAEEERAVWAEVWRRGFLEVSAIDPAHYPRVAAATAQLHGRDGWTLYLAFCQGKPAAAGGLYVGDGIGTLAFAGTAPEYRRRGCQQALLRARMADAAARGCDLVAAQAALGATSHHNMERAGFRIAYTRTFWVSRTP